MFIVLMQALYRNLAVSVKKRLRYFGAGWHYNPEG